MNAGGVQPSVLSPGMERHPKYEDSVPCKIGISYASIGYFLLMQVILSS